MANPEGFRVEGLGFGVQGLEFVVQGLGFKVAGRTSLSSASSRH